MVPFELPSEFSPDPVTEVIQAGDRELPRTAVQAEVAAFIVEQAHLLNAASRQRLVRHGFLGGLPHIGEISMAMRKLGYQRAPRMAR